MPGSWAEEFQKQNGLAEKWVEEMSGLSLDDASQQEKAAPVIENSKLMVERLTSDKNQRFQNSKFLNFVSKMSRGEVILEGNEVRCLSHFSVLAMSCGGARYETRVSSVLQASSLVVVEPGLCCAVCVCEIVMKGEGRVGGVDGGGAERTC